VVEAERAWAMSDGLGRTAVRGVVWSGGGQLARQAIQLPVSIVLARLLVPGDFGLVGMTLVFVTLAQFLADFGIGSAIVQARNVTRTTLVSCFWANVGVGVLLASALALAAPAVASFYGDPRVAPLLAASSVVLVFAGGLTVPRALLLKSMDFRADARAQVGGALAGAALALGAAASGLGAWSLVLQALAANAATLLLTTLQAAWRPGLDFSWSSIRPLVSFSSGVFGSNLLSHATRNADNLLIGKFLGSGPLGHYALAYRLMLYPLNHVSWVISRVLFPTLATLQHDLVRFRRAYLASLASIATVTFPMMLGLLAVAPDFVRVVLGEQWMAMRTVLEVFCVLGLIQSVGTTVGTLYMSTGNTRSMFLTNLAFTPVCIAAFAVGLRWGIEGVAIAYALVSGGWLYGSLALAFRTVELRMREFHRALAGPAAAAFAMYVVVVAVGRAVAPRIDGPASRLALGIGVGVAAYALASLLFNRERLKEMALRLRSAVGREQPTTP
jgi:PST family polysaccharide transporter